MVKQSRSIHHKALEILSRHPEIIGLSKKDIAVASIEPLLFYRGSFYAEPDLVFELTNRKAIIIEYKSNGHKKLVSKARGQLEKAVDFYEKVMGVSTKGLLITGTSYPELTNPKYKKKKTPKNSSLKRRNHNGSSPIS